MFLYLRYPVNGHGIPLSDAYNGMIAEHIVEQEHLAAQNETPKGRKPYTLVNLPLYYAGKLIRKMD